MVGNTLLRALSQFWKDTAKSSPSWKTWGLTWETWETMKFWKHLALSTFRDNNQFKFLPKMKSKRPEEDPLILSKLKVKLKVKESEKEIQKTLGRSPYLVKIKSKSKRRWKWNPKDLRTISLSCPLHSLPARLRSDKMSTVGKITWTHHLSKSKSKWKWKWTHHLKKSKSKWRWKWKWTHYLSIK